MRIWVDAQMSPAIATWISSNYAVNAVAIRDLGLRHAEDKEFFERARQEKAVVMTKDSDFVLTCGNTSNSRLREVLTKTLPKALDLLNSGEASRD